MRERRSRISLPLNPGYEYHCRGRIGKGNIFSLEPNVAGARLVDAKQHARDLCAPAAHQSAQAEDLSEYPVGGSHRNSGSPMRATHCASGSVTETSAFKVRAVLATSSKGVFTLAR